PLPPSLQPSPVLRPHPTEDAAPRKRSRSDMTTEERKEARAHRNRIAAQHSRDKRKAQFSALEARIGELEAENRALRAGMAHSHPVAIDNTEQRAADAAREAETRALRDRVRTLETAWEAILRTLQTQGTMAGLPTLPPPFPVRTNTPPPSSSSVLSSPSPSPSHSMTTFPVMVPPNPIFSLDDAIFPISPSPSNVSLPSNTSSSSILDLTHEPTCHSARVVSTSSSVVPLQRVDPCKQSRTFKCPLVLVKTRPSTKRRWTNSSVRYWPRPPRRPPRRRL
ncbi:hypothetical protein EDB83DRAFT_2190410, partial [Lactarius deliciosus]